MLEGKIVEAPRKSSGSPSGGWFDSQLPGYEGAIVVQAVLMNTCCLCMSKERSEASETVYFSNQLSSSCIWLKNAAFV